MKIVDIQYADTGETRTDGRYPNRIGSEVEFCQEPCVGNCMFLEYVADNKGNPKDGILRTSAVQSIVRSSSEITVITSKSIYCFEINKKERRCVDMTEKDRATIQRMLGKIEGVAFVADEKIATPLFDALEVIDSVINREKGDA